MPNARVALTQVRGLIPLIDPKRITDPTISRARNVVIDADGPKSGFSSRVLVGNYACQKAFADPLDVASFRVANETETFFFTHKAAFKYDTPNRNLVPVLTYSWGLTSFFPFTHAVVNSVDYFARQGTGLIAYDSTTGEWTFLNNTVVPGIPNGILACAESQGRLVVAVPGATHWSAIDDGQDFITSTTTGAGFQSLSLIGAAGAGLQLAVWGYPGGILTFTRRGIMRSQAVNSINPFRHEAWSDLEAINPYCIAPFDNDKIIFLTRRGFYITDGYKRPELWQPAMSEYLHARLLPTLDLTFNSMLRLYVAPTRDWVILSYNTTGSAEGYYNQAWVYYGPSNEWGIFNRLHTAFVDLHFEDAQDVNLGFKLGFVDNLGAVHLLTDTTFHDNYTDSDSIWVLDLRGRSEWPAELQPITATLPNGICTFSSVGYITGDISDRFTSPNVYDRRIVVDDVIAALTVPPEGGTIGGTPKQFASYCDVEGGLRIFRQAVLPPVKSALDAYIEIGLFRGGRNADIDELSTIIDLAISMEEGAIGDMFEDYIADYSPDDIFFDWSTGDDTAEDWGFDSDAFSEYKAEIVGTIDGKNPWEGNSNTDAELIYTSGGTRFYSANVTGLHLLVKIKADAVGESFFLKTLEATVQPSGRLQ